MPSSTKTNVFSIRLTVEQNQKLAAYCERTGRNKITVIRKVCEQIEKLGEIIFSN